MGLFCLSKYGSLATKTMKNLSRAGALLLALLLTVTSVFSQTTSSSGGGGGGSATVVVSTPEREARAASIVAERKVMAESIVAKREALREPNPFDQINSLFASIITALQAMKDGLAAPVEPGIAIVTVSDPGQPMEQTVPLRALVPFTDINLSIANAEFGQSVFITVQRRGWLNETNPDLYLVLPDGKSFAWGPFKLNGGGQALLGPIYVYGEKFLRVSVLAKLDTLDTSITKGRDKDDPRTLAFDVTGVSIDGYSTVQKTIEFRGRFPILGATHTIDSHSQVGTLSFRNSEFVQARSIVKNVPSQVLGGFKTIATGEASSHNLLTFYVDGGGADIGPVTNWEIVNEDGVPVAGPVEAFGVKIGDGGESGGGYLTFEETIVFPVGEHHYFIRAKVGASFTGTSITVSLPDIQSQPAKGQTTGHLFFPDAPFGWGPTMTVRGPSKVKVSVQKTVVVGYPVDSKQVVAGSKQAEVLQIVWDTTEAYGNIAVTTLKGLGFDIGGGFRSSDMSNAWMWFGNNAIYTGGNIGNPVTDGEKKINFGPEMVLPAKTVTVTSLRLDIGSAAKGVFVWGLDSGSVEAFDLTTGESVEVEVVSGVGPVIEVVQSGGFLVQSAPTSPTTAKKGSAVMFQGNLVYAPSEIAEIELSAGALEGLSGTGGGFIEFDIEVAGGIGNVGQAIMLVIGDRQMSGVMRPSAPNVGAIMFSLDNLRISAGENVIAKLYAEILPGFPSNGTITVSQKQGQLTGLVSGMRITATGPDVLSTVTVVP